MSLISIPAGADAPQYPSSLARIGEVRMWHGAVASIAAVWGKGWQLADGTNGTADLRDKFIVGAGLSYAMGATGGTTSITLGTANLPAHNHGITDPGHNHTINNPAHTHTLNDPGHAHSISDPGHNHGLNDPSHTHVFNAGDSGSGSNYGSGNGNAYGPRSGFQAAFTGITLNAAVTGIGIFGAYTGISLNSATTTISANSTTTGIVTTNTGSGAAFDPRPPYYALCYIEFTG